MPEVTTRICSGCGRYQLHLPGGLYMVHVTRKIERVKGSALALRSDQDADKTKTVEFCTRCLTRGDRFIFERALETSQERHARKEAADAKTQETGKDADSKPTS